MLKRGNKKYIEFTETDQTLKQLEKGRVSRATQLQYITTLFRKEKKRLESEINKSHRRKIKRLRELGMTRGEMDNMGLGNRY